MRYRLLLASLLTLLTGAQVSSAALSKYAVRTTNLTEYNFNSPVVEIMTGDPEASLSSTAVIDDDGGSGFPILKKLVFVSGGGPNGTTVNLPGLSGFIYIKQRGAEGPAPNQTGTGEISTAIEWGDVTGYTATGGSFCHSVPSSICTSAGRVDSDTVPPPLESNHYDIGQWRFHGTGFRGDPQVMQTNTQAMLGGLGNFQRIPRGLKRQDGTVPGLPLLGIGVVGASVLAMGVASIRRQR